MRCSSLRSGHLPEYVSSNGVYVQNICLIHQKSSLKGKLKRSFARTTLGSICIFLAIFYDS